MKPLETFVAVYESGSFAAAARRCQMAPSSVSRTISSLEESLQGYDSAWKFRQGSETMSVPIQPGLLISNTTAIRECAREGLGLALLADWTVADDLKTGTLKRVLPEWQAAGPRFDPAVSLVFPSRSYRPRAVQVFTEFLESALIVEGHSEAAPPT